MFYLSCPKQRFSHARNFFGIDGFSFVSSMMASRAAFLTGSVPLIILIPNEMVSLFSINSFIAAASSGGIVWVSVVAVSMLVWF